MNKSKLLVVLIIVAYISFVITQFTGHENICLISRSLLLPIFALLYFSKVKEKTLFFTLFFVFFAVSDLMVLAESVLPYSINYYYLGNSLYIIAYGFLLFKICKSVCVFHVLKNHRIHLVVLTALNIYIVYVLQIIINPYVEFGNEFFLELIYNIMILLVLSVSLLNYFYKDNKKSLYLFIGSLSMVFSEVINVAYLYVSETSMLNFISSSLAVLAFYFYYQQAKLENETTHQYSMQ
jgi:hypothetical protein